MKPISKLNRVERRRIARPVRFALFVALCVGLLQLRLAAIYARPAAVPAALAESPSRREDAELFNRALALGLLRLAADGRIVIAPADLPLRQAYARAYPELLAPRAGEPDGLDGSWNDESRRLHRALHFSASGRYVRQQIEAFNARQWLAAVRWRSAAGLAGDWRADRDGTPLLLTTVMPPRADRLLPEATQGWQSWRRVARWPALAEDRAPVRFWLTLARPARRGERLEVLAMGGAPTVTGAVVLASEPRCLQPSFCAEPQAAAHWLRLELAAGATEVTLSVAPLPAAAVSDLHRYEYTHVQREGGRLIWRAIWPGAGGLTDAPPAAKSGE